MSAAGMVCVACSWQAESLDAMKAHYRTDFHVYNLKRKTEDLPPITLAAFQRRKAAGACARRSATGPAGASVQTSSA